MNGFRLSSVSFDRLAGWDQDNHLAAYDAFRNSAEAAGSRVYRTGSLGISVDDLEPAFAMARAMKSPSREQARSFFEENFTPFSIIPEGGDSGFVTGFYEPVAAASRERSDKFRYPVYRKPPELVEISEQYPPAGIPAGSRFALKTERGYQPCPDREAIENGALGGLGLEFAWLSDRVDLFFIHVQGAARLRMSDGEVLPITYAAKSGHPFTGPGRILAALGEIPADKVTMQSIRAWFSGNPARVDEILRQNRSFIFFRESEAPDPALGPVAAAKVQLTPGRSLAVDRLIHTFSTPFLVEAPQLEMPDGKPFRRLMVAQDTGSAIVGPARGDIFTGTGDEAGDVAGVIRHRADFHILVPASVAGRFTR